MSVRTPGLLPIFRSANQLKLLGLVMTRSGETFSIAEIARRTSVPQQTVSREVERLRRAGLVRVRTEGRSRLVEAEDRSPYFPDLRALLLKAVGPADTLSDVLTKIPGVDEAFIFGSWARRYHGELGPPPNDLDALVVGDVDIDEIDAACASVGRRLGLQVNAVQATADEWASGSSAFLRGVRKSALVRVVP